MNVALHKNTRSRLEPLRHHHAGSYIFSGPRAVGKATTAYELARQLNCQGDEAGPCGPCRQFEAGNYPDLITVQPEDKPSILIEQIRGLVQSLSLSPYYSRGARTVVIDSAHTMTTEAQNALLKLIEEPPPQTVFILVTEQSESLLPTVRSRCQTIHFPRLTQNEITELLSHRSGLKPSEASALALSANGLPGEAVKLAGDPATVQARLELSRLADAITGQTTFERLITAARLAGDKTADLAGFGRLLHTGIMDRLRAGTLEPESAAVSLSALERFRAHLRAKVGGRVALERLMLEF